MVDGGRWDGQCGRRQQLVVADDDNRQRPTTIDGSPGGRQWWTTAMNGGGRQQQMVDKVNKKRINWYEVRKIVLSKYKIDEKNGMK